MTFLHVSEQVEEIGELEGNTLLTDTPVGEQCTADILIAEFYQKLIRDSGQESSGTYPKQTPFPAKTSGDADAILRSAGRLAATKSAWE